MKILPLLLCAALTVCLPHPLLFAADQIPLAKALTPENPGANAQSKQLLIQQLTQNLERAKTIDQGRLWFAGLGLDSGSKAFRGDVDLVQKRISQINTTRLSFVMDNHPQAENLDRPFAHFGNLNEVVKNIGKHRRENDVLVLFLSAHGNVPFLATEIGNQRYADIQANQLANALDQVKDLPTLIIISACHSGSLIPALEKPTRIILTAAAKEKTSYGCQPLSNNTFFVEKYFGEAFDPKLSVRANFDSARKRIAERETAEKLIPSEPQIFVGEKMKSVADKAINEWLSLAPPTPSASTTGAK